MSEKNSGAPDTTPERRQEISSPASSSIHIQSSRDQRQNHAACPTCGHVPPIPAQGLPGAVCRRLLDARIRVWGSDVIGCARAGKIRPDHYRKIESGKCRPSSTVAAALADALYLPTTEYLMLLDHSAFGAGRDRKAVAG